MRRILALLMICATGCTMGPVAQIGSPAHPAVQLGSATKPAVEFQQPIVAPNAITAPVQVGSSSKPAVQVGPETQPFIAPNAINANVQVGPTDKPLVQVVNQVPQIDLKPLAWAGGIIGGLIAVALVIHAVLQHVFGTRRDRQWLERTYPRPTRPESHVMPLQNREKK